MTNRWTPERRAKMAEMVRQWKPWKKSTGPVTMKGKRKSSKNARRTTRAIFKRIAPNIQNTPDGLKTNNETSMSGKALQNKGLGIDTTKQLPAKAGGFELRTESPDTRRLNDASYSGSILKSSFGLGSK
jgi:hypothetical protein